MAFYIISFLLLFFYAAIIFYYRRGWLQIKNYTSAASEKIAGHVFISVIIAARNEEKNILKCLTSVFEQTYPANLFEVLLVDDDCSDTTVPIAASLKKSNLHIISLKDFVKEKDFNSYKKKAIETAISFAKGTLLVTTDADCIVPPKWLDTIANFYSQNDPVFIAAPVVFNDPLPGDTLFKKIIKIFQSLDFMTLQGITGAAVYNKFHSMCNGANLAYTKEAFIKVGGFEGINNIASGDDMLLMNKIQNVYPDRIKFLKSANVVVKTEPASSLKEFMQQRIRWASKASHYTDAKITGVLLLVYIFNAWIFIMGICSFFLRPCFYLFLILLILKTFVELIILFPVAKFFKKQNLLWWFFPAQPFHIIYTLIAGWLGKFGSYKWKERSVK